MSIRSNPEKKKKENLMHTSSGTGICQLNSNFFVIFLNHNSEKAKKEKI